jgi:hypothetical protein
MEQSDIKEKFKDLDKAQLIDLIADLYKKNISIRDYVDYYDNREHTTLLKTHREKVYQAFYPKNGSKSNPLDAKKAINNFRKLGTGPFHQAELMLYYVQMGVDFTDKNREINRPFYKSLGDVYLRALTLLFDKGALDHFAELASTIVKDAAELQRAFGDYFEQIYYDFYPGAAKDTEDIDSTDTDSEFDNMRYLNRVK